MPRIGRIVVPNMPHHVVQRGHDRNAVFVEDQIKNKSVPVSLSAVVSPCPYER